MAWPSPEMVLHRDNRHMQTRKKPDLAPPQAGCIDQNFTDQFALVGLDIPVAIGKLRDTGRLVAPVDPRGIRMRG